MTGKNFEFGLNTDQTIVAREVATRRILEISLKAPTAARLEQRPSLNLALVLDRSGSMAGEKLEYVKQAASHVLDLLQEQDQVALVAYDDEVNLLSPVTRVTNGNRAELKRRIALLRPGGSTNLGGGWLTGCQEVAAAAQNTTLNRALLLTDGLANVGMVDLEDLARHAREISRRGVSTSTFGVGRGFNEYLLEAMSNQGSGNFYYIETPSDIPGIFHREFDELAAVTVRDVEINLDFPAHLRLKVLGGWVAEFSEGRLHLSLGNLYSGQSQQIFIKFSTPPLNGASELKFNARIYGKDENNQLLEAQDEVVFNYADLKDVEAAPLNQALLERFASVDLADTATEALKLERRGENQRASAMLMQSLHENFAAMPAAEAAQYQHMSERIQRGMDEFDRKQSHFNSYNRKRHRPD
jgi:Ca-activated chloride channel family protein